MSETHSKENHRLYNEVNTGSTIETELIKEESKHIKEENENHQEESQRLYNVFNTGSTIETEHIEEKQGIHQGVKQRLYNDECDEHQTQSNRLYNEVNTDSRSEEEVLYDVCNVHNKLVESLVDLFVRYYINSVIDASGKEALSYPPKFNKEETKV